MKKLTPLQRTAHQLRIAGILMGFDPFSIGGTGGPTGDGFTCDCYDDAATVMVDKPNEYPFDSMLAARKAFGYKIDEKAWSSAMINIQVYLELFVEN